MLISAISHGRSDYLRTGSPAPPNPSYLKMLQQSHEKLRWAAVQLLENYLRCGVVLVPRGTNTFYDMGTTTPKSENPSKTLELTASETTVQSTTSPSAKPLPPMPVIASRGPVRSLPNSRSASIPSSPILELSEPTWSKLSIPESERQEAFDRLRPQVAGCRKCEELACTRKQTVFGVGSLTPRVVFFGEAPGADEDRQGEPFVGAAGQLLNKIIAASQMKREDVYILNSLKCRPPGNRTPVDAEIENCRPFFEAQLEILQPEFIVCLGAVAVRAVLRTTDSVGRLRGRFHRYRQAKVLVTYHPAYLLRNESAKRLVWEDMKMLMREMGVKLPNHA